MTKAKVAEKPAKVSAKTRKSPTKQPFLFGVEEKK